MKKVCKVCNKEFIQGQNNDLRKYCSYECQELYRKQYSLQFRANQNKQSRKERLSSYKKQVLELEEIKHNNYIPIIFLGLTISQAYMYKFHIREHMLKRKTVSVRKKRVDDKIKIYKNVVALNPKEAYRLCKETLSRYNENHSMITKEKLNNVKKVYKLINNYIPKIKDNIYYE